MEYGVAILLLRRCVTVRYSADGGGSCCFPWLVPDSCLVGRCDSIHYYLDRLGGDQIDWPAMTVTMLARQVGPGTCCQ